MGAQDAQSGLCMALSLIVLVCTAAVPMARGADPFPPPRQGADPFPPPPAQMSGATKAPPVDQMVERLRQRLEREPDDVKGWVLLGRSYEYMGQDAEARAAFARARDLGYTGESAPPAPAGQGAAPVHSGTVNPVIMQDISATIREAQSRRSDDTAASDGDPPP